jgi:hypothetical protein
VLIVNVYSSGTTLGLRRLWTTAEALLPEKEIESSWSLAVLVVSVGRNSCGMIPVVALAASVVV